LRHEDGKSEQRKKERKDKVGGGTAIPAFIAE
jgi:hypothetical protein